MVLWGLIRYRKIKKIQAIATIALVVFMWIVLASTVFTREQTIRRYKLIPFWSWEKIIFEKDMSLLQENFLNCILLMPIGCLLPMVMAHAVKLKNVFAEYSNAIVHAFQKFRAPFSGKIVHIFPEQSAVI